jgi:hypothetical protein
LESESICGLASIFYLSARGPNPNEHRDKSHLAIAIPRVKESETHPRRNRPVLAAHYGFADEELDFPSIKLRAGINYDIKYRMGRDAACEEGE